MKTCTQQELEEYARQKQLELLDEVKDMRVTKLSVMSEYMHGKVDGYNQCIEDILNKKREQLISENKDEK